MRESDPLLVINHHMPDIFSLDQYRTVRYDNDMNEQMKIIEAADGAKRGADRGAKCDPKCQVTSGTENQEANEAENKADDDTQNATENASEPKPSARAQEVLSVVLDLMVEEGDGFSMASVAKRASCSKETLYRWFGDRDGLLTATVKWQASKVIMPKLNPQELTKTSFCQILEEFAQSWLTVITGEVSIALNRLAVSHAGNNSSLGHIVLTNGPFAMRERLEPIFTLGKQAGLIEIEPDKAFTCFFGLVVSHHQIRALLGDEEKLTDKQIQQFAKAAVENFMTLSVNQTI